MLRRDMDSSQAERMALVRLTAAALVLGWAAMRPDSLWLPMPAMAILALGYAIVVVGTEAGRRLGWLDGARSSIGVLALDGAFLAVATYATGGTQGPTAALLYLHVVAVMLVLGWRTGVAIATWHSIGLVASLGAQAASLVPAVDLAPGTSLAMERLPVLHASAFWLFVAVTALLAALQERDSARREADAQARAGLAVVLDQLHERRPPVSAHDAAAPPTAARAVTAPEPQPARWTEPPASPDSPLLFQPIVELASGRIAGLEALAAFVRGARGGSTAGGNIGRWALRRACEQMMAWRAAGLVPHDLFVSVDLSAEEVAEPGFVGAVEETLAWTQVDPAQVMLNVDRPAPDLAAVSTTAGLEAVRALGVRVAVDAGGASAEAGRPRAAGVDALRVSAGSPRAAHPGDRRVTTVVVGIEDAETAERMRAAGFTYGQGGFFARPMTAAEITNGVEGLATDHRWVPAADTAPVNRRNQRLALETLARPTAA